MRSRLGSVLPALMLATAPIALLSACGGDDSSADAGGSSSAGSSATASDTASATASATPSASPAPVDFKLVTTITATVGGGKARDEGVPLTDPGAISAFAAQFKDNLAGQVTDAAAAAKPSSSQLLYGAIVAVGCDSPTEVTVTKGDSGFAIDAVPVADPKPECLAPMTTVALVLISASALG